MAEAHLASVAYRERIRREILHRSDLIAPLPEVVVRALGLLKRTDADPRALEQCITQDQVLVGKLLGLVNSPFYGLRRPVGAVRDAIMVVGFRGLRSLLLASGTAALLKRDYRCFGHEPGGLMRHSLAVATAGRALGLACGQDAGQAEEMFVAGLLHDIGKMVVAPYLAERPVDLGTEPAAALATERDLLGVDHAEASALVAARWNLGTSLCDLLGRHHGSPEVGPPGREVALLRLADDLAHGIGLGYLGGRAPRPLLRSEDVHALGLEAGQWEEVRAALEEQIPQALGEAAAV